MSRTDYEAKVGTILRGKWTLERLIGVGGMAAVYVGRHKIGRSAAIKVLHADIAMDAQVRARFEQEALAVNSVGHRGVVEIIDIDTTADGSLFLIMELLKGETLADRVEHKGLLSEKAMLNVADEVLDVLIACHKKDIVHRDIKPENLFLLADGGVKVLDFGIARVRQGVKTMAGTMLGTVAFMPPEQIKGVEVDARADLFGLGATMFTCLAGRRIHRADSDAELASKMLTRAAPPFDKIYPRGSAALAMLVDRALAFLPERRYPDALTMRGDVWAVRRGEHPPYAHACEKAGQSAAALELAPDGSDKRRPASKKQPPVESTRPQLPVFLDDPPAAAATTRADGEQRGKTPRSVPATTPQMPVFADQRQSADEPAAAAKRRKPPPADGEPAPSSEPTPRSAANAAPAPAQASISDEPSVGEPSAGEPSAGEPSAGGEPAVGAEAAPPSADSAARSSSPAADADADPASEAPLSAGPLSLMPDSEPPPRPQAASADKPAAATGGGQGWTILAIVLALLAIGLFAAWRAGLINSPTKPPRRSGLARISAPQLNRRATRSAEATATIRCDCQRSARGSKLDRAGSRRRAAAKNA